MGAELNEKRGLCN